MQAALALEVVSSVVLPVSRPRGAIDHIANQLGLSNESGVGNPLAATKK
jgi:hypothetical protein